MLDVVSHRDTRIKTSVRDQHGPPAWPQRGGQGPGGAGEAGGLLCRPGQPLQGSGLTTTTQHPHPLRQQVQGNEGSELSATRPARLEQPTENTVTAPWCVHTPGRRTSYCYPRGRVWARERRGLKPQTGRRTQQKSIFSQFFSYGPRSRIQHGWLLTGHLVPKSFVSLQGEPRWLFLS